MSSEISLIASTCLAKYSDSGKFWKAGSFSSSLFSWGHFAKPGSPTSARSKYACIARYDIEP